MKKSGSAIYLCFFFSILENIKKFKIYFFNDKSPLNCQEIKPVNPKGSQSWIFIGRTDAEAEAPVLWLPDAKSWLIRKDPGAGKDWRQEEKGTTEDEMVGWHHQLNGHGFGWTPGVGDGQGGLACCDSWGRKESDRTEQLIWSDLICPLLVMLGKRHSENRCKFSVLKAADILLWTLLCRSSVVLSFLHKKCKNTLWD